MKKIFTLIAAAFMAASVNAQGTFALQNGDPASAAGTQVTSVDNIIFTWGVAGDDGFKGGNKKSEVLKDALGSTAYCEGNGKNGKLTEGTVYFFLSLQSTAQSLLVSYSIQARRSMYRM